MKAILHKVPISIDSSFAVRLVRSPYFNIPWHFHPEYELVLILKSTGKRFIGDCITDFSPGDLVLLGSNIPHWYRNDAIYHEGLAKTQAESLVIQFDNNFLGSSFFDKPESTDIKKLLNQASLGLAINGTTQKKIAVMMKDMLKMSKMNRLIHLLHILSILSKSDDLTKLSNEVIAEVRYKDSERMNTIYNYVMTNYTEQISLPDMANILNMSDSTFCRYFKKFTGKTFSYFLNEIRIGHVCKMLIENEDLNITQICYASGYNNISYFNRQFKILKNQTPQQFKQNYKPKFD